MPPPERIPTVHAGGKKRRKVLFPPDVRVAVLAAFYQERPEPKDLVAWCRGKAQEMRVSPQRMARFVGDLTQDLEREVAMLMGSEADRIAAASGLTLSRALRRLNELMDARKTVFRNMRDGTPDQVVEIPDNQVAHAAVETALTYFGRMEQRFNVHHQHEHEHRHLVMNLTDEDLLKQIKELHSRTQQMLDSHETIDVIPEQQVTPLDLSIKVPDLPGRNGASGRTGSTNGSS